MTPAEINARIQPFTAREIGRYLFRVGLFTKRGLTEDEANHLADRLALRDQERDDRRMCIECEHLAPMYHCKVGGFPVRGMLQRCHLFSWQTP